MRGEETSDQRGKSQAAWPRGGVGNVSKGPLAKKKENRGKGRKNVGLACQKRSALAGKKEDGMKGFQLS